MKLPKALSLISLAFGSILSVSADEYKFENIKYHQFKEEQNIYQPKDKLDAYIINGATYSTKFVPLMNDDAEGSGSSRSRLWEGSTRSGGTAPQTNSDRR